MTDSRDSLAQDVLAGQRRAIARLITRIENRHPTASPTLDALFPHTGQAHLIGVTGAPGTGKSSLVTHIARAYRQQGKSVAIIAVDPTSPFTGGAILGDRIRMRDLAGDPGIFIRSMANKGNLGGLSWATQSVVHVFDAAGFDVILIETVGAGQSEVDIAKTAHSVLVVEAPGLGDDVQAIKAGILEIADILVVNKADRPGAIKTMSALKAMLALGTNQPQHAGHHRSLGATAADDAAETPAITQPKAASWQIPVLKTSTTTPEGLDVLVENIQAHYTYLKASGMWQEREKARILGDFEARLQASLMAHLKSRLPQDYLENLGQKLVDRTLAPYNASQGLIDDFLLQ